MAKLDMSHGFIKYITKNQVDRDNYDKKVKENPKSRKTPSTTNKPRRPPIEIYKPPTRQGDTSTQSNEESDTKPTKTLHSKVNICFMDEHEQTHYFTVYKTDDPMEIAAEFCSSRNYDEVYVKPLADKIVQECRIYFDGAC